MEQLTAPCQEWRRGGQVTTAAALLACSL